MAEKTKKSAEQPKTGVGRIIGIVAVVAALVLVIVLGSSSTQTAPIDKAWNKEMTVGSENAKLSYVMYTDLMCPYCSVFSREVMNHWDEFLAYLNEHHILFEVRLTDALYYGVNSSMSLASAEAGYCAKREDKFWEFYHGALQSLWDDYHSKGVGINKTAPAIKGMTEDYWADVAHEAGLGETFDDCYYGHEAADEVAETTMKALQIADGMPTFVFGKFTNSGFSDTWDWEYVKRYLDAGL